MQDFAAASFTFETEKAQKLDHFQMSDKTNELSEVYRIPVKQTFQTQFGTFELLQNCYAAKEEGEWKILWSYGS
jgi:hypothetical protein